jgi:hypothetical protein
MAKRTPTQKRTSNQKRTPTYINGFLEEDWVRFSDEQRRAALAGKPVYDFSTADMARKIKILAVAFICVGAMFIVTGIALLYVEQGYDTPLYMLGLMYGIILLGSALGLSGVFLLALIKHPQWAPGVKWGMLAFCIATGVYLLIVTKLSGSAIISDLCQVFVVWYAMSAIIKQGQVYRLDQ